MHLFLPLVIILLIGCTGEDSFHVTREGTDYSFTTFIKSINNFPYEASKSKQGEVRTGYKSLSIGMDKKDVLEMLGEPDAESLYYDSVKGQETFLNSSWGYYLHRHERELANEKFDRAVFIYFDVNEKMFWALPTNIESLAEIGSPFPLK